MSKPENNNLGKTNDNAGCWGCLATITMIQSGMSIFQEAYLPILLKALTDFTP